jgi:hypothetical protein
MAATQSEIKAFLDSRSEAISTGDLDRLMSFYSPDIVYFDIVPPLQYVGSAALRERFSRLDHRDERGRRGGIHADQIKRNPEERRRGWILGARDLQLSTVG